MVKLVVLATLGAALTAQDFSYRIDTVAGRVPEDDGGPAISAVLRIPLAAVRDRSGSLFIAEVSASRIRKVSPAGLIDTIARSIASDLAVDRQGNLYFVDFGPFLWRITPSGQRTIFAGNTSGQRLEVGPATSVRLRSVSGVSVDDQGNVYIADSGDLRVRKITADGIIQTVARDGVGLLGNPSKLAVDKAGNLYISFPSRYQVWKLATNGNLEIIAGNGRFGRPMTGERAAASPFGSISGVAVDSAGSVLIVRERSR